MMSWLGSSAQLFVSSSSSFPRLFLKEEEEPSPMYFFLQTVILLVAMPLFRYDCFNFFFSKISNILKVRGQSSSYNNKQHKYVVRTRTTILVFLVRAAYYIYRTFHAWFFHP
jgi:hypothetical protein